MKEEKPLKAVIGRGQEIFCSTIRVISTLTLAQCERDYTMLTVCGLTSNITKMVW